MCVLARVLNFAANLNLFYTHTFFFKTESHVVKLATTCRTDTWQPQKHTSQRVPSRLGSFRTHCSTCGEPTAEHRAGPFCPTWGRSVRQLCPCSLLVAAPWWEPHRRQTHCSSFPLTSHRRHTCTGVRGRSSPTTPNRSLALWLHHRVYPARTQTAETCYEDSEAGDKRRRETQVRKHTCRRIQRT